METESYINVAIADDHTIVRKGVCGIILSFEKFIVLFEASNGKELLDKMSSAKVLPDIVILDVSMPKLDGYDTLVQIKKKWPNIKVLVLTMFNNEFSIIKMIRNGANGYLLKNSDPKDLEKALFTIYKNSFYNSEIVSNHLYHVIHKSEILPQITEKEKNFLSFCGTDLSYEEIAIKLKVSTRSVVGFRDSLFEKLKVNSRPALTVWAIKLGFISID